MYKRKDVELEIKIFLGIWLLKSYVDCFIGLFLKFEV